MAILVSSAFGFTPPSATAIFPTSTARSMSEASPTEEAFVIDSERRALMNVIVLGSATVTVGAMAVPYLAFFFPPVPGDSTGAIPAKGSYIILCFHSPACSCFSRLQQMPTHSLFPIVTWLLRCAWKWHLFERVSKVETRGWSILGAGPQRRRGLFDCERR